MTTTQPELQARDRVKMLDRRPLGGEPIGAVRPGVQPLDRPRHRRRCRSARPTRSIAPCRRPPRRCRPGPRRRSSSGPGCMFRFRERLAAHAEELAQPGHARARQDAGRGAGVGPARRRGRRVRLRHPQPDHGPVAAEHRPAGRLRDDPPPGRRLRGDHAVQLPGDGPALDVPGRDRLRQHVRAQAVGEGAAVGGPARRAADGVRGCPTGSSTSCTATRECVDALLTHPLVRAVSFVGSTAVARHVYETGTQQRQAGPGGRRGEEPPDHHARRRPRPGRRRAPALGLRLRRRALHGRQRRRARRQGRRSAGRAALRQARAG